jgi:hypothetical protein
MSASVVAMCRSQAQREVPAQFGSGEKCSSVGKCLESDGGYRGAAKPIKSQGA